MRETWSEECSSFLLLLKCFCSSYLVYIFCYSLKSCPVLELGPGWLLFLLLKSGPALARRSGCMAHSGSVQPWTVERGCSELWPCAAAAGQCGVRDDARAWAEAKLSRSSVKIFGYFLFASRTVCRFLQSALWGLMNLCLCCCWYEM